MAWESIDPATGSILKVEQLGRGLNFPDHAFSGDGWPVLEKSLDLGESLGSCVVVTPYTPRHARHLDRSGSCVDAAKSYSMGPFSEVTHIFVEDKDRLGPGWGRNDIVKNCPVKADWFLFVDADDMVKPHVFEAMRWLRDRDKELPDIVWGQIEHRDTRGEEVVMLGNAGAYEPFGWNRFLARGHDRGAGVNVGFFLRAGLATAHQWFEQQYHLEDIEYFATLMAHGAFTRLPFPLVTVDVLTESTADLRKTASGHKQSWSTVKNFWRRHGRLPLTEEYRGVRNEAAVSGKGLKDFYGV